MREIPQRAINVLLKGIKAVIEGGAMLRQHEGEAWQDTSTRAEKETMDSQSQSLVQEYIAGPDTGGSISSRSDDAVPVAWRETSSVPFTFSRKENPFCQKRTDLGWVSSFGRNRHR